MAEIILKTDKPDKAAQVLKEALETETLRLKYSLDLAKKRLKDLKLSTIFHQRNSLVSGALKT